MEIENIACSALSAYAQNSRTHSVEQVAQIAASITEFGFTNPALVNPDYRLIAGHGRLLAAISLGMASIPCIVLHGLSEAQQRALVIADNQLALNAGWDDEILSSELAALADDDFDLSLLGIADEEIERLLTTVDLEPGAGADEDEFFLKVKMADEHDQPALYEELIKRGYECKRI